jgi:hypothetical protein
MQFTVKMNPRLRVLSLALLVGSCIMFHWFSMEFLHFVIYPFLEYPSLAGPPTGHSSNYAWNAALLSVFFLQHYIMADLTFKKRMSEAFALFPAFERYIFNITAALLFIFCVRNV